MKKIDAQELENGSQVLSPVYEVMGAVDVAMKYLERIGIRVGDQIQTLHEELNSRVGGETLFTMLKTAGYSFAEVAEWIEDTGRENEISIRPAVTTLKRIYGEK